MCGVIKIEDHPRACGEQLFQSPEFQSPLGSSPRMRGAGVSFADLQTLVGIIPAHAGSRLIPTCTSSRMQDHPRACGEQSILKRFVTFCLGSSPRMRGAVQALHLDV